MNATGLGGDIIDWWEGTAPGNAGGPALGKNGSAFKMGRNRQVVGDLEAPPMSFFFCAAMAMPMLTVGVGWLGRPTRTSRSRTRLFGSSTSTQPTPPSSTTW